MTEFAQGTPVADDCPAGRHHHHSHSHSRRSHHKDEAQIIREKNRRAKRMKKTFSRVLFLTLSILALIIIAAVVYLYVLV